MLVLNVSVDQLVIPSSVHWHSHVLRGGGGGMVMF